MNLPTVGPDLALPPPVSRIESNTHKSRCIRDRELYVAPVFLMAYLTQIRDIIVQRVPINMIELIRGPTLMNQEPNDPMGAEFNAVDPDQSVSVALNAPGDRPSFDLTVPHIHSPIELNGNLVVFEEPINLLIRHQALIPFSALECIHPNLRDHEFNTLSQSASA